VQLATLGAVTLVYEDESFTYRPTGLLISGTKKLLLKWIRTDLSQERTEVPDRNGPVRWTLANSFFRINRNDLEDVTCHETSKESFAILAEEDV
jgi:hypothetical protein